MDASDRIVEEFNCLCTMGPKRVLERPYAERVVYFVVTTRCEIDTDGFESVYEQIFQPPELSILIDGLRSLGENSLAEEFARGLELLQGEGFYDHHKWDIVSRNAKEQMAAIGERVGDRLWGLDEKLVALLEDQKE